MNRGPSSYLLGTFYRSSINRRVFKKMENNIGIFYSQKTFLRSPMDRRTFSGLLWTEDLLHVFIDLWDFTSLIGTGFLQTRWKGHQVSYDQRHSKGPKTLTGSAWNEEVVHVFYGPTTFYSPLWAKDLLQVFYGQRPSTGLPWTAVTL